MEKPPLHLKHPDLQSSDEVERAVERKERHTGESVPNDPSDRLDAYTERLEHIFLNPDERVRERNLDLFRDQIYDALIVKKENFPDSYFELQKRVARERGQAVEEIPEHVREQMMETAIEDQRASLDAWIDYLTSEDAVYPPWFKYFVWRNITKLSQFDKERGEFKQRASSTVAPYPDIYREPLAQIADIYEKVKADNKSLTDPEIKDAFSKKFPRLYAELIQKSLAAQIEHKEEIRGEWVLYKKGEEGAAEKLHHSLQSKGTGWCTAGQTTAKTQVESGDFYVYYTRDKDGKPTQPRLAIRMDENRLAEVRGILPHQEVEPIMQDVLDTKLKDFGTEADIYRKKSEDMRMLTALAKKRENDEPFTRDDLVFLYEINTPIEGFGYRSDPRIAELRHGRNAEEDMLVIFDCTREQIAHIPSQINQNTKAYVGQLEPGIFQKLPENLEHVYTSYPEGKIRRETVEIGGKSTEQLISEMEAAGINISNDAKHMLKSHEFVPGNREEATLIRLTVADLGFEGSAHADQIYERAQILGLELCPADTGPNYRLKYRNQPLGERFRIGMKLIHSLPGGACDAFALDHNEGGLWLSDAGIDPAFGLVPHDMFVFRLRPPQQKATDGLGTSH